MDPHERHRRPIDADSVDIDDADDVVYWTTTFDVSLDRLKASVFAVGPRSTDVRRHLRESADDAP
jgi:hypothetical protein